MVGEDLGLIPNTDSVFAVVALFDGSGGFQQRENGSPLNVMTDRMLKDL
jgi:hypothetical protein